MVFMMMMVMKMNEGWRLAQTTDSTVDEMVMM